MTPKPAEWMIERAARRWPGDLSEIMADEWRAELAATKGWRSLTFAASLALSCAVEPEGEEPPSRLWLAATAGVTLLAAALFNGVHLAQHLMGDRFAALLALPVLAMVVIGVRSRAHVLPRIVVLGVGLFAFLMAGNQVAVMPFMGWLDITPAVVVWTALTLVTARLVAAGRGKVALLTGVVGTLVTLDLATIAGSLHAATKLGLGYASAVGWFPLAMLPGGKASEGILLGNASAMAGPMLLCSAFIAAIALRESDAIALRESKTTAPRGTRRIALPKTIDPQILLGAGAALAGLAVADLLRRLGPGPEAAITHRLADNSMVFGFGFFAHTPGRVIFAVLAGLLAAQAGKRLNTHEDC